jgi:hypothetical protein
MDQDPFGLAERPVAGGVSLEQWEDGQTYYLAGFGRDDGGGLVDGTVQQLGWNERYVLAWRTPNFRSDGKGWMIVDGTTGKVQGPFAKEELRNHPEVARIRALPVAEAWERMPTHVWRFWLVLAGVAAVIGLGIRGRRQNRRGGRREPPMANVASLP